MFKDKNDHNDFRILFSLRDFNSTVSYDYG